MKRFLYLAPLALVAACAQQPEPLCDREAVEWDKWGTPLLTGACAEPGPLLGTPLRPGDPKHPPGEPPCCGPVPPGEPPTTPPKQPPSEPPSEPPAGKVKGNNGLGNGDQRAPGNSLDRNRAENQRGNPGHASGKAQNSN